MNTFSIVLLVIAMGVTLVVLFAGLLTMARGGEASRRNSNKLMRWRIMAQAAALLLFAIAMMTKDS